MKSHLAGAAIVSCAIMAAGGAAAGPNFGTDASATAPFDNSGIIVGPPDPTATAAFHGKAGSATGFAAASPGALSVETFASSSPYPHCDNECGNVGATAEADFYDTLTVTGPAGDIASFRLGAGVDGSVFSGGGGSNASIHIDIAASFGGTTATLVAINEFSTSGKISLSPSPPITISLPVGQTIFLSGQASAGAVGVFGGGPSEAGDPAQVFIEPLTPDTNYVAASGVVYPSSVSSVPEPATVTLLATAFVLGASLAWLVASKKNTRLTADAISLFGL